MKSEGTRNVPKKTRVIIKRTHSRAPSPADALAQSMAAFQCAGRELSTKGTFSRSPHVLASEASSAQVMSQKMTARTSKTLSVMILARWYGKVG